MTMQSCEVPLSLASAMVAEEAYLHVVATSSRFAGPKCAENMETWLERLRKGKSTYAEPYERFLSKFFDCNVTVRPKR